MTRIAIISDIHSNLPALLAVKNDIENRNIDFVFCLGDIIGKGPSPLECINVCRNFCDKIIFGNWEDFLINSNKNENPIQYYRNKLGNDEISFIKSWNYFIEFYLSGKIVRMFHAHPNDIYKRVYYESELSLHLEMFDCPKNSIFKNKKTDIAIYGDIHYHFKINYDDNFYKFIFENSNAINFETFFDENKKYIDNLNNKILINTGSVGQSFDSIFATYLILEGDINSKFDGDINIEFIRVVYDNLKAAEIALNSDMYDKHFYANEILTGIFRGLRTFNKD